MRREAGILMPVSALPSRYGIGGFGKESYRFVDLLVDGGFKLWQILPLNPLGYGHSPYQPFSSYAIDEIYIDLDDLFEQGLLAVRPTDVWKDAPKVEYEAIREWMAPYLEEAFEKACKTEPKSEGAKISDPIDAFMKEHKWAWMWAVFMSQKRKNDLRSWNEWPGPLRTSVRAIRYELWLQMNLYREWQKLRAYANDKGIRIIGDVPFYVGYDSCDVWSAMENFEIDPITKEAVWIAGVPPDYFSATGQRWGNPIYKWDLLEKNGFSFLIDRLIGNHELYDIVRLDHFRAFDTYWRIPSTCETAVEGAWIEAPGYAFFDTLKSKSDMEIIAEDLGDLRPEVLTLRDHFDFPGMNVVEFTFHDAEIAHTADVRRENMVAYIGTHDNDPFMGYYAALSEGDKAEWKEGLKNYGGEDDPLIDKVLRYTMSLPAKYAIISMQDVLGLGTESRLNVPSTINDVNWTWRLADYSPFEKRLPFLRKLIDESGRN